MNVWEERTILMLLMEKLGWRGRSSDNPATPSLCLEMSSPQKKRPKDDDDDDEEDHVSQESRQSASEENADAEDEINPRIFYPSHELPSTKLVPHSSISPSDPGFLRHNFQLGVRQLSPGAVLPRELGARIEDGLGVRNVIVSTPSGTPFPDVFEAEILAGVDKNSVVVSIYAEEIEDDRDRPESNDCTINDETIGGRPGVEDPPSFDAPYAAWLTSSSSHHWTLEDRTMIMAARRSGMEWDPIQQACFPLRTVAACKNQHGQLMSGKLVAPAQKDEPPEGWQRRYDIGKRPYYANLNAMLTTWAVPRVLNIRYGVYFGSKSGFNEMSDDRSDIQNLPEVFPLRHALLLLAVEILAKGRPLSGINKVVIITSSQDLVAKFSEMGIDGAPFGYIHRIIKDLEDKGVKVMFWLVPEEWNQEAKQAAREPR